MNKITRDGWFEEPMDEAEAMKQEFRQRFREFDEKFVHVDDRFDRVDTRFDRMDARFDRMDTRFDTLQAIMLQHMRWTIGLLVSLVLGFMATQVGILFKMSELVDKF